MEAPEGFRNSDEDHFSESQVTEESGACFEEGAEHENCVGKMKDGGENMLVFSPNRSRVWRMCRT